MKKQFYILNLASKLNLASNKEAMNEDAMGFYFFLYV